MSCALVFLLILEHPLTEKGEESLRSFSSNSLTQTLLWFWR